jgi:hypothetical protein
MFVLMLMIFREGVATAQDMSMIRSVSMKMRAECHDQFEGIRLSPKKSGRVSPAAFS